MKPLFGKSCYLSAPIDFDTNSVNWRPEVIKTLESRFGLKVFDPHADPKQSRADELIKAKEAEDYDTMAEIAGDFVSKDLNKVARVDFLIANLPHAVPTYGTTHEIVNAVNGKIPTLLVCTKGKKFLPSWFFGVLRNKHKQYLHGSWDSLYNYLEEVNDKKHTNDRRWYYVYEMI